jgi:hypothetical protein
MMSQLHQYLDNLQEYGGRILFDSSLSSEERLVKLRQVYTKTRKYAGKLDTGGRNNAVASAGNLLALGLILSGKGREAVFLFQRVINTLPVGTCDGERA